MQEKVVFDTNVYIGIFNQGFYREEVNAFEKIMFLAHPVLHELWIGARGKKEIKHLVHFGTTFIKLGRLITPTPNTQLLIGQTCQKLRKRGKLDPTFPKIYNDVCIALLVRQIGATLVTRNTSDFKKIYDVIDFDYRDAVLKE